MSVGKWKICSFLINSLTMFLWKQMKVQQLCEVGGSTLIIQTLFCNPSRSILTSSPLPLFSFFLSTPLSHFWTWDSFQIFSVWGFVGCLAHPSSTQELSWVSRSSMWCTPAIDSCRRIIYDISLNHPMLFEGVSRQWWSMSFPDNNIDYNPLKNKASQTSGK